MITPTKKEQKFIDAYFECVNFTEDNSNLFCEIWEREQVIECLAFMVYAECYLADDAIEQAGHDFWLSRNGHGSGFWDRDYSYYGDHVRDWLQRKSEQFGETTALYNEIGPEIDHWARLRRDYPAIERATQ